MVRKICEIVELYLLGKLSNLLGKENNGLYRDDGLAVINSCSGLVLDRTRKTSSPYSNITIETNLAETDFLDVTFNLVVTEK